MLLPAILFFLTISTWAAPWEGLADFDDTHAGTSVLPYLKMPVGARAMAMGAYEGPNIKGPSTFFWNPAGLWRMNGYQTMLSHTEVLGELRHEAVVGVIPVPKLGPLGLGLNGLFTTPFEGARDLDENDVRISASDISLSAGWGREIIPQTLSVGGRISWLRSSLDEVVGNGYSLDLGIVGRTYFGGEFSFSMHNIAHGFQYNSGTNVTEKLPTLIRLGIGDNFGNAKPLYWHAAWSKGNDAWQRLHGGVEWWLLPSLAVRGGYESSLQNHGLNKWRGLSIGSGIRIHTLMLDYALRLEGELGVQHVFTLSVGPPPILQTKRDPLEEIRRAYAKGACVDVVRLAQTLLRAKPDAWDALAMQQECEKRLREGVEINNLVIAITANTQGQMSPVWSEARMLGGLPRRKSFFDGLRRQFPRVVMLDAGRLLDTSSARASDEWMVRLYDPLRYDAVLAGDAELRRLRPWQGPVALLSWVRSQQVDSAAATSVKTQRRAAIRGADVRILGFGLDSLGRFAHEQAAQAIRTTRASMTDSNVVLIVLLDGNLAHAQQLVNETPDIDVLIVSGMQEALERPLWLGSTMVGSPGLWGTHVLVLTQRQAGATPWSYQLHPLDALVPEDSLMLALMEEFRLGVGAQENAFVISDEGREDFLFFRELGDNKRDVYLKEAATNHNVRLTRHPESYKTVQMAWSRQLLLLLHENGKLGLQQLPHKEVKFPLSDGWKVERAGFGAFENWIYFIAQDSTGKKDLFRMTYLGNHRENLSGGRLGQPMDFAFSPDGRYLALQTKKSDGEQVIYHVNYTLTRPVRISPSGIDSRAPAYDPVNGRLAFLARSPGADTSHWNLLLWDSQTDSLRQITQGRRVQSFSWIDGQRVVLGFGVNVPNLHVLDVDHGTERPLNLPDADRPWHESKPRRLWVEGRAGILYERHDGQRRILRWSQEDSRAHRNLTEGTLSD